VVRLIREEGVRPALVVGMPVGFVSAAESKDLLMTLNDVPWVAIRGRKGGSTLVVAAIHALLAGRSRAAQAGLSDTGHERFFRPKSARRRPARARQPHRFHHRRLLGGGGAAATLGLLTGEVPDACLPCCRMAARSALP
jgi:hypothetical protein